MVYTEEETYRMWSLMEDSSDKIRIMVDIFAMNLEEAIFYNKKFERKRNRRIWENTHPIECSRVKINM